MTFTISTHTVVVATCWIIGLAFAVIDVIYVPDWAALSTAFIVLAATLSVRKAVAKYAANWTSAYEIGRGSGGEPSPRVRRLPD